MAVTVIVGPTGTHDLSLTDSASTETGFRVVGEDNTLDTPPAITITREPVAPTRSVEGIFRYSDMPPDVDLVWDIETFHHGGLSNRWTPELGRSADASVTPHRNAAGRYNQADGCDARVPGEFGMANAIDSLHPFILNADFGAATGWTLGGTAAISGGNLTLSASGDSARQTLNNPTVYRSRSVIARARVTANSGNVDIRIGFYIDGSIAGATTTVTVTSGTTAIVSHTQAVGAGISTIALYIDKNTNGATTATVSDCWCLTGSFNVPRIGGILEFNDEQYFVFGSAVLTLGSSNQLDVVYIQSSGSNIEGLGVSPSILLPLDCM